MKYFSKFLLLEFSVVLLLSACNDKAGSETEIQTAAKRYPEFTTPRLQQGRAVWMDNCQACHGTGLAGAPVIGNKQHWQARIAKGKTVLVEHALNGFQGPSGSEMPARGGNDALSDEQVTSAVEYMLKLSE